MNQKYLALKYFSFMAFNKFVFVNYYFKSTNIQFFEIFSFNHYELI